MRVRSLRAEADGPCCLHVVTWWLRMRERTKATDSWKRVASQIEAESLAPWRSRARPDRQAIAQNNRPLRVRLDGGKQMRIPPNQVLFLGQRQWAEFDCSQEPLPDEIRILLWLMDGAARLLSLGRPPTKPKPLDVIPLHFRREQIQLRLDIARLARLERARRHAERQLRLGYPDAKAKLKRIASAEQRALRGESEPARRHAASLK